MLPDGKSHVKEHPEVWRADQVISCNAVSIWACFLICVTCGGVSAAEAVALSILRMMEAILESWGLLLSPLFTPEVPGHL